MKNIVFLGYEGALAFDRYQNGRVMMRLYCVDDGEPLATCTVNIPEYPLEEGEVIIKDYSENEGMFNVLEDAGIVKRTGKMVSSGFITCPVCKLLVAPIETC